MIYAAILLFVCYVALCCFFIPKEVKDDKLGNNGYADDFDYVYNILRRLSK